MTPTLKFIPTLPLFVLLLGLSACNRKPPEPPPPPPPPVDALVLPNLLGHEPAEIRTDSLKGNVQLLVFLRTDDAPCRAAIADWNALQAEFAPRGFTVVGLVDDSRPLPVLSAEAATLGAAFPLGHAGERVAAAFGGPPALRAIPTAFLLNRNGAIVRTYSGFPPLDKIREDVDNSLERRRLSTLKPKDTQP